MRFIPILFFYLIAILGSNTWGACREYSSFKNYTPNGRPLCSYGSKCSTSSSRTECFDLCIDTQCPSVWVNSNSYDVGVDDTKYCLDHYIASDNCYYTSLFKQCYYSYRCDNKNDADSLVCVQGGNHWNGTECRQCGEYKCKTITSHSAVKDNNSSVVCLGKSCNNYNCKIFSQLQEICTNECGDSTITTIATDTTYYEDAACDPERYFEDCSASNFCYEVGTNYVLYKKCLTGQIINGTETQSTKIISSGKGSCADQGYLSQSPEQNTPQDSMSLGGGGQDSIPDNCLLFGIGCPADTSSVNYSSSSNRNEQNGCICSAYDGLSYLSIITCPDGSSSTFYGSCDDWKSPPTSSSSSPSEPSSSAADTTGTGGGTSSGNTPTDWATWSQMREQIILQGNSNYKLDQVNSNLNNINNGINEINNTLNSSIPMPNLDTTEGSISSISAKDTINKIMGYMPTKNTIIDTLEMQDISNGTCPELYILKNDIKILTLTIPATKLNLADIGGFNLCKISRAILILLAEIVSSILIIGLFRKFSG